MSGTARVGLIGAGPWVHLAIGPAIAAAPDVELVAVWARRRAAASEVVAAFGGQVVVEPGDVFAACDAVAFSVPPEVQAGLLPAAVAADVALLLEKPTARSVAAASVVHDHGRVVLTHFSRLLDPAVGPWLSSCAERPWESGRAVIAGNVNIDRGNPFGNSPWRRADDGALWDVGPHALATLQVVLGPVVDVTARRHESGVRVSTTHEGGATGDIVLSLASSEPADVLEFTAPDGMVEHRPKPTANGVDTYSEMLSLLRRAPTNAAERAVADPRFGTSVVAALVSAANSLAPRQVWSL